MKFTIQFLAYQSQLQVKLLHRRFMRALGQTLLILEFCLLGCCVVPTNRVSVD